MAKTIIIGAGMAGLIAARTLVDAGHEAVVLEARARVGGRTHTDRSLGVHADLGASWIHGTDGNPLTAMAEAAGVEMAYTDFLNRSETAVQAYDHDGTPLDQAEYTKGQLLANAAFVHAEGSILYTPPNKAKTLKDWVEHGFPKPDNLSRAAELGFHYYTLIRSEYTDAADWDTIDWNIADSYAPLPGGDHLLFGGGFNGLTDHVAEGLDVRLETAVSQISHSKEGVTLQTSAGEMTCDYVVVTVPLGVLKSGAIHFSPELPKEKLGAIERVGFGHYEKLVMRFDKFYWPKEAQRFNYLSEGEPTLFNAWLNLGHYTGEPVIVAYHAGRRARHINQWSDGDLIENTIEVMQRIFGDNGFGDIPAPEAYLRTNWQSDPFSLGSYSFDQVGQKPNDRKILAKGVNGRLFFAGEATHPHYYATVHGAYETGVRAAREVLGASNKSKE